MSLSSYGSIVNIWHRDAKEIIGKIGRIEEKVDGSQFSFGVINGEYQCRSKGQSFPWNAAPGQFSAAATNTRALNLPEGYTFRGEVLAKPRHNKLEYGRVPRHNVIAYDAEYDGVLVSRRKLEEICAAADLEVVPCLYEGPISLEGLERYIGESVLGGQMEGVVCKVGYLRVKFVSDSFREKMGKPKNKKGFIEDLIEQYRTEARWEKAVQHLRDKGVLTGTPKDIGPLMKELNQDFEREELDNIAPLVVKWAMREIKHGVSNGFPDWYQRHLGDTA